MSFFGIFQLLIALVAYGEPTPSSYYMHDVVRPKRAFMGDSWQKHYETRCPPFVGFLLPYTFLVSNRSIRCFWGLLVWMLSIGRARHPGPDTSSYPPGFSIEFLNVGCWLSGSDLALESSAHFLAVAEHRLVPARARAVTTQLRQARRSSVWAPSCQDVTPGGHAGVGVISLHGAPLSLPTLVDPSFKEFFRIGRAMRVILPLGNGGVVHLFVIYGYQGAESDPEKLQLTDRLFTAVLAEARMCCCGQPVILAGDFNADPVVIPSLAKGISDGHWVDLECAFAFGRGVPPSSTCQFQLDEDKGSRRDFLMVCPVALAAASACYVSPDRWFTPHFSVCAEFSLSSWDAVVERARVGFRFPIARVLQRLLKFVIFGMFTFGKLVLYLLRFVRSFFVSVAPLMLIRLGSFGVKKPKLVLLVLIFLLVALHFPTPVVMLVVALFLFTPCGWVVGVVIVFIA